MCWALRSMTAISAVRKTVAGNAGAVEAVLRVMRGHQGNTGVQGQACGGVYFLTAHNVLNMTRAKVGFGCVDGTLGEQKGGKGGARPFAANDALRGSASMSVRERGESRGERVHMVFDDRKENIYIKRWPSERLMMSSEHVI